MLSSSELQKQEDSEQERIDTFESNEQGPHEETFGLAQQQSRKHVLMDQDFINDAAARQKQRQASVAALKVVRKQYYDNSEFVKGNSSSDKAKQTVNNSQTNKTATELRLKDNSVANRASVTYDNQHGKTMNNDILDNYTHGAITPHARRAAMMSSKLGRMLDDESPEVPPVTAGKKTELREPSPVETQSPAFSSVIGGRGGIMQSRNHEHLAMISSEMSSGQMIKHNSTKQFADNGNLQKVKSHRMDCQVRNMSSKLVIGGQQLNGNNMLSGTSPFTPSTQLLNDSRMFKPQKLVLRQVSPGGEHNSAQCKNKFAAMRLASSSGSEMLSENRGDYNMSPTLKLTQSPRLLLRNTKQTAKLKPSMDSSQVCQNQQMVQLHAESSSKASLISQNAAIQRTTQKISELHKKQTSRKTSSTKRNGMNSDLVNVNDRGTLPSQSYLLVIGDNDSSAAKQDECTMIDQLLQLGNDHKSSKQTMTTNVQNSFDVLIGLQNSLADAQPVPPINLREFVAFQDRNSSRRSDKEDLTALGSQMRRLQRRYRKRYRAKMQQMHGQGRRFNEQTFMSTTEWGSGTEFESSRLPETLRSRSPVGQDSCTSDTYVQIGESVDISVLDGAKDLIYVTTSNNRMQPLISTEVASPSSMHEDDAIPTSPRFTNFKKEDQSPLDRKKAIHVQMQRLRRLTKKKQEAKLKASKEEKKVVRDASFIESVIFNQGKRRILEKPCAAFGHGKSGARHRSMMERDFHRLQNAIEVIQRLQDGAQLSSEEAGSSLGPTSGVQGWRGDCKSRRSLNAAKGSVNEMWSHTVAVPLPAARDTVSNGPRQHPGAPKSEAKMAKRDAGQNAPSIRSQVLNKHVEEPTAATKVGAQSPGQTLGNCSHEDPSATESPEPHNLSFVNLPPAQVDATPPDAGANQNVNFQGANSKSVKRPLEINTVDISIEDQSREPNTGAEVTRNLAILPGVGYCSDLMPEHFSSNQDIRETSGDLIKGDDIRSQESPSVATSPEPLTQQSQQMRTHDDNQRRKSEVSRRQVVKREPYYDYFNVSGSLRSREEDKAVSREHVVALSPPPKSSQGPNAPKASQSHALQSPQEANEKEQMQLTSVYERQMHPFNVDQIRPPQSNIQVDKEQHLQPPRPKKFLAGEEALLASSSSQLAAWDDAKLEGAEGLQLGKVSSLLLNVAPVKNNMQSPRTLSDADLLMVHGNPVVIYKDSRAAAGSAMINRDIEGRHFSQHFQMGHQMEKFASGSTLAIDNVAYVRANQNASRDTSTGSLIVKNAAAATFMTKKPRRISTQGFSPETIVSVRGVTSSCDNRQSGSFEQTKEAKKCIEQLKEIKQKKQSQHLMSRRGRKQIESLLEERFNKFKLSPRKAPQFTLTPPHVFQQTPSGSRLIYEVSTDGVGDEGRRQRKISHKHGIMLVNGRVEPQKQWQFFGSRRQISPVGTEPSRDDAPDQRKEPWHTGKHRSALNYMPLFGLDQCQTRTDDTYTMEHVDQSTGTSRNHLGLENSLIGAERRVHHNSGMVERIEKYKAPNHLGSSNRAQHMRVAINSLNELFSGRASDNESAPGTAQMSPLPTQTNKDVSSKGNDEAAPGIKLSFDNLADTEKNLLPMLRGDRFSRDGSGPKLQSNKPGYRRSINVSRNRDPLPQVHQPSTQMLTESITTNTNNGGASGQNKVLSSSNRVPKSSINSRELLNQKRSRHMSPDMIQSDSRQHGDMLKVYSRNKLQMGSSEDLHSVLNSPERPKVSVPSPPSKFNEVRAAQYNQSRQVPLAQRPDSTPTLPGLATGDGRSDFTSPLRTRETPYAVETARQIDGIVAASQELPHESSESLQLQSLTQQISAKVQVVKMNSKTPKKEDKKLADKIKSVTPQRQGSYVEPKNHPIGLDTFGGPVKRPIHEESLVESLAESSHNPNFIKQSQKVIPRQPVRPLHLVQVDSASNSLSPGGYSAQRLAGILNSEDRKASIEDTEPTARQSTFREHETLALQATTDAQRTMRMNDTRAHAQSTVTAQLSGNHIMRSSQQFQEHNLMGGVHRGQQINFGSRIDESEIRSREAKMGTTYTGNMKAVSLASQRLSMPSGRSNEPQGAEYWRLNPVLTGGSQRIFQPNAGPTPRTQAANMALSPHSSTTFHHSKHFKSHFSPPASFQIGTSAHRDPNYSSNFAPGQSLNSPPHEKGTYPMSTNRMSAAFRRNERVLRLLVRSFDSGRHHSQEKKEEFTIVGVNKR